MSNEIIINNNGSIMLDGTYVGKFARYDLGDPGIKQIVDAFKELLESTEEEDITCIGVQILVAQANQAIYFYSTEQRDTEDEDIILRKDGTVTQGNDILGTISQSDTTDEETKSRAEKARMRITNAIMANKSIEDIERLLESENLAINRILPIKESAVHDTLSIEQAKQLVKLVESNIGDSKVIIWLDKGQYLKIKDTTDIHFRVPIGIEETDLVKYYIKDIPVIKVSSEDGETLTISESQGISMKEDASIDDAKKALAEIQQMVRDSMSTMSQSEISNIDDMLEQLAECIRKGLEDYEAPKITLSDIRTSIGSRVDEVSAIWAYDPNNRTYVPIKDREGDLPKSLFIKDIMEIALTEQRSTLVVDKLGGERYKTVLYYSGNSIKFRK